MYNVLIKKKGTFAHVECSGIKENKRTPAA